jgi:hypothetical protein
MVPMARSWTRHANPSPLTLIELHQTIAGDPESVHYHCCHRPPRPARYPRTTQGPAIKAGEFILGYPDETGNLPAMPQPEILGRNGTYLGFRKLHSRVAAFRQYLQANARSDAEQELLAAKLVGRWPSGAPLVLAPERDDQALGADAQRNNDFLYYDGDPHGLKCPLGSHIRRSNPRDALKDQGAVVNLHRILRRGATYGPMLPDGVLGGRRRRPRKHFRLYRQQRFAAVRVREIAVAQRWRVHRSGSGARCDCRGQRRLRHLYYP